MRQENILIIKHGAFGDFIAAFGPFTSIRKAHPEACLTLLTTAPFVDLAKKSGLFDTIWVDGKPKFWQLCQVRHLQKKLCAPKFSFVYDLQTSGRSSFYYHLMRVNGCKPGWSGIAAGCSHPHNNPNRNQLHTKARHWEQLQMAGIQANCPPDFSFLQGPTAAFGLKSPFILLVPGCSPSRPEKRWPHFAALASQLFNKGYQCVFIGGPSERTLIKQIKADLPPKAKETKKDMALDLSGQTSFEQLASLARAAAAAVGNDTGPMHLFATLGTPSLTLFSGHSNPQLCAPKGPGAQYLQKPDLNDLSTEAVYTTLLELIDRRKKEAPHP